jgi:hypothetical protein
MKRFLGLILLCALIYGGYYFYSTTFNSSKRGTSTLIKPRMNITQAPSSFGDIFSVLGATTSKLWESGLDGLNTVTDGAAEPVINKAVNDLQSRIKDLPKEQYEKVKYEFCKDVVTSYEKK